MTGRAIKRKPRHNGKIRFTKPRASMDPAAILTRYRDGVALIFRSRPLKLVRPGYRDRDL